MMENAITVSEFAEANGHDRRTVMRRIRANGIKSVDTRGVYSLYAPEILASLMQEDDEASAPTGQRCTPYGTFEQAHDAAIYAIGEAVPQALRNAIEKSGTKVARKQFDRLALDLWTELGRAIENELAKISVHGGPCPALVSSIIKDNEWPEALRPIVARVKA